MVIRKPMSEQEEVYQNAVIESLEKRVGKLTRMTEEEKVNTFYLIGDNLYNHPDRSRIGEMAKGYDAFHLPKNEKDKGIIERVAIELKNAGNPMIQIYDDLTLAVGRMSRDGKFSELGEKLYCAKI